MKKSLGILFVLPLFVVSGCYSCRTWHSIWGTGPVNPKVADRFFWDPECKPIAAPKPPAPPPTKPTRLVPKPSTDCGPNIVERTYPVQPVIKLNRTMPKEVELNNIFDYSIKITNLTNITVKEVVVTETLPQGFQYTSSLPGTTQTGNKIAWKFASLAPKASQEIKVFGKATDTDCLEFCADITYIVPACGFVKVVEPRLTLQKTAPAECLVCDPIPVKIVATNTGTGPAEKIELVDMLPTGLLTADGKSQLRLNAGTLGPGQSRQFAVELRASKPGKYVNKVLATSASGLKAESAPTVTIVRQPVLKVTKTGPQTHYLGRPVMYHITVTNTGDGVAKTTIVEDTLPAAVTSLKVSGGGKLSGSKVVWQLGTLAPNTSKKVSISFMPTKAGTFTNTATACAYCAEPVTTSVQTSVAGIPAVLLEVIDIEDPIPVGGQTTYVITATNQGSALATNIRIACFLEEALNYVSSSGASIGSLQGSTVTFAPLPSLAPHAKASWRVIVKAAQPGDVRFKVTMYVGEFERPIEETEATHLYR